MTAPLAALSRCGPPPAFDLRAAFGTSMVVPEAVAAARAVRGEFAGIDALQRKARVAIARLSGAEAGFLTASSAAGVPPRPSHTPLT